MLKFLVTAFSVGSASAACYLWVTVIAVFTWVTGVCFYTIFYPTSFWSIVGVCLVFAVVAQVLAMVVWIVMGTTILTYRAVATRLSEGSV